ncbi:hypothetical protein A2757_01335 [Candidatus Giovannonibacteria bacterium RIFCSPHIGHO2_01_FULL_48_47]|nr:MAG: hypothetical protein A2757_01335 [Candidatus Giovannonibacteria bacterium RIFCSPHIGHO2_01_FULL_48_47]OGF67703.1 MAG: hypothetical protein A3D61_03560 [Candidatus Giovannonibacteria bacterium RIFCSPHIGHO2_02_FULL_48_15]OGF88011.1 MAG: hypothetical protein A3B26_00810 [Candidatus Giovannonibacteria bacterium RIFCSPLOWO2_01_FULL_48_47]OGF95852.1 MAG: hypothetical protein A2613_03460 [Candidatus Giovannonibacteria bacterium RIFOXYD1_FULL_48_21]
MWGEFRRARAGSEASEISVRIFAKKSSDFVQGVEPVANLSHFQKNFCVRRKASPIVLRGFLQLFYFVKSGSSRIFFGEL